MLASLLTAFIVLLMMARASFAEEAEEPVVLEPVVVEEEYEAPPLNYPSAFSTVIDTEDFGGEFNTTSELLSFSPGVQIRDFGGFGQLKSLSIRGSSPEQVVVLLDGVRITSPLGGGVDLSTIPVDIAQRFEIVRGGASALAGTDAIGGVLNIITKKTRKPFSRASLTGGSFGTLSLNLLQAGAIGDLGYLIFYAHAQTEGDFDFESVNGFTVERINNEFLSESLLAKFTYPLPNRWELTALNEFFFDDKGVPGLGEFQEDSSNQRDLRNLTSVKLAKQGFIRRDIDFALTAFHRFDRLEFENDEPLLGVPIDTKSSTFAFGANPKFTWYAPLNQVLTLGMEARGEVLRNDDFDNPERFTLSTFVGDEIGLFEGLILLTPIARFDFFRTLGREDSTDASLSPKLGIVLSPPLPHKFLSLRANVGRSFRAPSFSELFLPEQGFIGGNPELDNESSLDLDAGIVLSHPLGSLSVNYFRNHINDLIMFVFVSANRIEPRNIGEVTEQGIEASLVARPFVFFQLNASYTLLDGEVEDTGAQLPGRAENVFDLRAVLTHPNFKLFWEVHFVDEIPFTPFPNSATTKARTTHDLGAQIGWGGVFVTAEIKNLFDNRKVRDAFDFPLPGIQVFFSGGIKFQ